MRKTDVHVGSPIQSNMRLSMSLVDLRFQAENACLLVFLNECQSISFSIL